MKIQTVFLQKIGLLSSGSLCWRNRLQWKLWLVCLLALFFTLPLGAQEAAQPPERPFTVRKEWVRQQGGQTVIFQRVDPPPALPSAAPLPPVKAPDLSPQELEALRQREAKPRTVLLLSATVFDHRFTELRWTGEGGKFRAFSSVDFQYLGGMQEIETADAIYTVMLALADGTATEAEEMTRKFPQITLLPKDRAAWVPAEDPARENARVLVALDAIHTYYDAHRAELVRTHEQRTAAEAERQRQLREHPPVPKTMVIRYWKKPAPIAPPAAQEAGK